MSELMKTLLTAAAAFGGCKTCIHRLEKAGVDKDNFCYMFKEQPGYHCLSHDPIKSEALIRQLIKEELNKEPPCK